jgi:hypothetical protein
MALLALAAAAAATTAAAVPPLLAPILTPAWPGTFNTSESTFAFIDSADRTGTATPFGDERFGAVVYGWAFDKGAAPADHGELAKITEQCAANKKLNPRQRCFTYLNLELALGWYTSERAVQDNTTLSHELLIKASNGTVLYDSPGPTMLQAFWDYRSPAVIEYWKNVILAQVVASPHLDGVLYDDVTGFPNEHPVMAKAFCEPGAYNITTQSCPAVLAVRAATHAAISTLTHHLAGEKKSIFQRHVLSHPFQL